MSLRWLLILYAFIPFGLVVAALGWLGLGAAQQQTEARLEEELELIARALEPPLARALERERSGAVQRTLDGAFRFGRIFSAHLYDGDGNLLAHAGEADPASPPGEAAAAARERAPQTKARDTVEGRDVFSHFQPITGGSDDVRAVLQLTRPKRDFEARFDDLRLTGASLVAAATLATCLFILLAHRVIVGRPLDKLLRTLRSVEPGRTNLRAPLEGPYELVAVGREINGMLNNIERSHVTIREQAEAERTLKDRLVQSERLASLGRLASGVAHELGTPLSVIRAKVRRLRRRFSAESRSVPELDEIEGESQRIEHTLRQLLHMSSDGSGQPAELGLRRVVRSAVEAVRGLYDERGIVLEERGDETGARVFGDPVRIEQAVVCLLQNAADASGVGGRVRVDWFVEGPWVAVRVEDDGPGMSEAMWQRAVQPFFSTKAASGRGFGLALAAGVAEEHRGALRCETGELGGARITLWLPRTVD